MKNFYSLPLRTGDSRKVIKCQICPAAQAAFRIFAGNNLVYAESSGIQRPQSNCRPSCFANTRTVHCPGFGTLHQLYECLLTETCPHGRSRNLRLPENPFATANRRQQPFRHATIPANRTRNSLPSPYRECLLVFKPGLQRPPYLIL